MITRSKTKIVGMTSTKRKPLAFKTEASLSQVIQLRLCDFLSI